MDPSRTNRPPGELRATSAPPLYVLAGGESRRFGRDKALFELDGVPLLKRVADSLAQCTADCTIVADRAAKYDDLGLRTIPDQVRGAGPLAGLQAALADLRDRGGAWLLLASCDRIALRSSWVALLTEAVHGATSRPVLAAAFRERTHWSPFPGLYHRDLAPQVEASLASGRYAMHQLLDGVDSLAVPTPPGWEQVRDINSPADLP